MATDGALNSPSENPQAGNAAPAAPPVEISANDDALLAAQPAEGEGRLLYWLSVPERAVRSGAGLVGGALRESAALLVPQSFQSSRTYTVMVRQMLDFLAEDVGGVQRKPATSDQPGVENFVARKAVGNFVDMASLATLHVSPLLLLAIVSDIAYGSQSYLQELSDELKREDIIAPGSKIEHASDLLSAVADATHTTSQAFNTPPLSVDGLRVTIEQTRQAVSAIDPTKILGPQEIRALWDEMRSVATRENVNLLAVSGAVTLGALGKIATTGRGALSGVRVAGQLFDRHVLDHYSQSLATIRSAGLFPTLAKTSQPYIAAVWQNFSSHRPTLTAEILSGRLAGNAWTAVSRWLGRGEANPPAN